MRLGGGVVKTRSGALPNRTGGRFEGVTTNAAASFVCDFDGVDGAVGTSVDASECARCSGRKASRDDAWLLTALAMTSLDGDARTLPAIGNETSGDATMGGEA